MKRKLGTAFLCLGVLSFGPASGYRIQRTIRDSFGHFQGASFGSLYPALGKLEASGKIACVDEKGAALEKRVFQITQSGLDELEAALHAPSPDENFRSDFLTAMYFSHLVDAEMIESLIHSRMGALQEENRALLSLPISQMSEGQRFTVRYRQAMLRGAIDFLKREGQAIVSAMRLENQ